MFLKKRIGRGRPARLQYLSIEQVTASDYPYAAGDEALTSALAGSISRYGLLHPLLVRREGKSYALIAGARRLAAAKQAGLRRVPCLIMRAGDADVSAIRLSENLHRHEPDFLEAAMELRELIYRHGFTIHEAAAYAGLSERDVTAKMRVLRLPKQTLFALRDSGLTERHALALLRITQDDVRDLALCEMAYTDMGPEAAERYVDTLLRMYPPEEVPGQRPIYIVKDVRMFLNSVSHGVDMMRGGGIDAECVREDADNCIKLTIRIPERRTG